MNIQHILVPIDFSPDSEQALDYAMELAQRFQSRLTLMHVIYVPVTTEVNLAAYFADMEAGVREGIEIYRKRAAEAGITVDMAIVRGTPFHEIIQTAKTQPIDLIVMGTHGRTGVTRPAYSGGGE